jgi:hypothetical protein
MLSLSAINSRLTTLASSLNITGPIVESLISLLSDAIYANEITSVNTVLESSFSRSTLLNSRIQHAGDLMYSVYRGKNQGLYFNVDDSSVAALNPVKYTSVKKFDQAVKVNSLYLYYNNDYTFTENSSPNIELVVSKEAVVTVEKSGNGKFYMDIIDTDISENVCVFESIGDSSWSNAITTVDSFTSLVQASTNTSTVGDNDSDKTLFILTLPGYGIRIFSVPGKEFNANLKYRIRYLKYTTETIDYDSTTGESVITTIPNFTPNSLSKGSPKVNVTESNLLALVSREDDIDDIYYNSLSLYKNNDIVNTNSGFKSIIKSLNYYNDRTMDGIDIVLSTGATNTIQVEDPSNTGSYITVAKGYENKLYIYYIMSDFADLTSNDIALIDNTLIKYYVNQEYSYINVAKNDSDAIGILTDSSISGNTKIEKMVSFNDSASTDKTHTFLVFWLDLIIYTKGDICDESDLRDVIDSYSAKISEDFNPYILLGKIQACDSNIVAVGIKGPVLSDGTYDKVPMSTITVPKGKHIAFVGSTKSDKSDITYESIDNSKF